MIGLSFIYVCFKIPKKFKIPFRFFFLLHTYLNIVCNVFHDDPVKGWKPKQCKVILYTTSVAGVSTFSDYFPVSVHLGCKLSCARNSYPASTEKCFLGVCVFHHGPRSCNYTVWPLLSSHNSHNLSSSNI